MQDANLKALQDAMFDMLIEVDRICHENGIRYFLDSGTLLGAVRHKDFIPWDDDADILMLREDYDRFEKIAETELPSNLVLRKYHDFDGYFVDYTPRIQRMDSQLHIEDEEDRILDNKLNKIWIDIFVLDKAPEDDRKLKMLRLKHKICYGLGIGHRISIHYENSLLNNLRVWVLSTAGKLMPLKSIYRLHEKISRSYNGTDTSVGYVTNQPIGEMMREFKWSLSWYETTERMLIRDHEFDVPGKYHEVLTHMFGDYMQLPPEEDRVPSHLIRNKNCQIKVGN